MMGHDNSWPVVLLRELPANECQVKPMLRGGVPGHESAVMATFLAIADQAVIIQFFTGLNHRWLWRPEQPIVRPQDAADETDVSDDDRSAVKQVNIGLLRCFAACGESRFHLAPVEFVIAWHVDNLAVLERCL